MLRVDRTFRVSRFGARTLKNARYWNLQTFGLPALHVSLLMRLVRKCEGLD